MILTMICLLLVTPYQAAFEINKRLCYWTVCKNFLLFLCCMDIIINFMTGYGLIEFIKFIKICIKLKIL